MAIKRNHIINHLINMYGYKKYLEIGISTGRNFDRINITHKESVDPSVNATYRMSSDVFFTNFSAGKFYDIIFIDGLHTADQVMKDILNSLDHLTDTGSIVVHDCNPKTMQQQLHIPPAEGPWYGQGWKSILSLRYSPAKVMIRTVDTDTGCCIIRRGQPEPLNLPLHRTLTFDLLQDYRKEILNLISVDEFFKIYRC